MAAPDHAAFHEPGHLHPLQDPQWETHQALQLHESTRHRDMAVSNNAPMGPIAKMQTILTNK